MQSSQFVEEAMDQHGDTVFRLACSMLDDIEAARDVTQDTFVKLFQSDIVFEHDGHHARRNSFTKKLCVSYASPPRRK